MNYKRPIDKPFYIPKGKIVSIQDLCDKKEYFKLISNIKNSNINKDIKNFLEIASTRHIGYNFQNIAEFYYRTKDEYKKYFELLNLVIIDDGSIDEAIKEYEKEINSELQKHITK